MILHSSTSLLIGILWYFLCDFIPINWGFGACFGVMDI